MENELEKPLRDLRAAIIRQWGEIPREIESELAVVERGIKSPPVFSDSAAETVLVPEPEAAS